MKNSYDEHISSIPLKIGLVLVLGTLAVVIGFVSPSILRAQSKVGDVNGDGVVSYGDYTLMVAAYGSLRGDERYDANVDIAPLPSEGGADGKVNAFDLNILASSLDK